MSMNLKWKYNAYCEEWYVNFNITYIIVTHASGDGWQWECRDFIEYGKVKYGIYQDKRFSYRDHGVVIPIPGYQCYFKTKEAAMRDSIKFLKAFVRPIVNKLFEITKEGKFK